jgi:hypothetical protein
VKLAPIWRYNAGNRSFAYLTGGMAGEQVSVSQGILRTPTYSLMIGHTVNVTRLVSLTADTFYEHRAGLYNRWGIDVSLAKRW